MNFKRIISFILIFAILITSLASTSFFVVSESNLESTTAKKNVNKLEIDDLPAKSYILTDYRSGQILYEKNADEKRAIASITKIMTILLVVEAIENKKISLEDMVTATESAKPSNYESSLWLQVGEKMSVRDLFKAVTVNSANDAARTLAEYVAGSEESFVELMNKRAEELKLSNTHFVNASGLDEEEHYSTARDIANLTRELFKHKWVINYTSIVKGSLRNGKFLLNNTNKLLQTYKGCNGLKTGTEERAGKCLCATAIRNNIGLCAVALGSTTGSEVCKTCTNLLDYGFNNFQPIHLNVDKIEEKEVPVLKGKKVFVKCTYEDSEFPYLIKKTKAQEVKKDIKIVDDVKAPVEKGQVLGSINYIGKDKEKIYSKNIVAAEEVEKLDFLYLFTSMYKNFFGGIGIYN